MTHIKRTIEAIYSPDMIKKLIVEDMHRCGFTEITVSDIVEPDDLDGRVRPADERPRKFEGYALRVIKAVEQKPKISTRGG